MVILLLVLAIALFFFNTSNAARLYHFSPGGDTPSWPWEYWSTASFIVSFGEISLNDGFAKAGSGLPVAYGIIAP